MALGFTSFIGTPQQIKSHAAHPHASSTKIHAFEFETCSKGRAGVVGHTRAINYYAVNNGSELSASFVKYDERKKDGRCRDVESKAYEILNYLNNNKDKAFYSNDIVKALGVKSCDIMANVRRFEKKGHFLSVKNVFLMN